MLGLKVLSHAEGSSRNCQRKGTCQFVKAGAPGTMLDGEGFVMTGVCITESMLSNLGQLYWLTWSPVSIIFTYLVSSLMSSMLACHRPGHRGGGRRRSCCHRQRAHAGRAQHTPRRSPRGSHRSRLECSGCACCTPLWLPTS